MAVRLVLCSTLLPAPFALVAIGCSSPGDHAATASQSMVVGSSGGGTTTTTGSGGSAAQSCPTQLTAWGPSISCTGGTGGGGHTQSIDIHEEGCVTTWGCVSKTDTPAMPLVLPSQANPSLVVCQDQAGNFITAPPPPGLAGLGCTTGIVETGSGFNTLTIWACPTAEMADAGVGQYTTLGSVPACDFAHYKFGYPDGGTQCSEVHVGSSITSSCAGNAVTNWTLVGETDFDPHDYIGGGCSGGCAAQLPH